MENSGDVLEKGLVFVLLPLVALWALWFVLRGLSPSVYLIPKRLGGRELLYGGVLVTALHIGYLNVNPGAFGWSMVHGVLNGEAAASPMWQRFEDIDGGFGDLGKQGNVALRFVDFEGANALHRDFVNFCYYRGVYAIYPHRLYCGSETQVVNSASDILTMHFEMDERWLDAHCVSNVVTYRVGKNGELLRDVVARNTRAGTQPSPDPRADH